MMISRCIGLCISQQRRAYETAQKASGFDETNLNLVFPNTRRRVQLRSGFSFRGCMVGVFSFDAE